MRASSLPEPDRNALPPGPRLPYASRTLLACQLTEPFPRYRCRRYGPTSTVRAYPAKAMVYITEPGDLKARDEWALSRHITLAPARCARLSIRRKHDHTGNEEQLHEPDHATGA